MKQAQSELIAIQVSPKSANKAIEGTTKDNNGKEWLKTRLATAPEDDKANKALIKFLAKALKCQQSSLEIISGFTSRHKIIRKIHD